MRDEDRRLGRACVRAFQAEHAAELRAPSRTASSATTLGRMSQARWADGVNPPATAALLPGTFDGPLACVQPAGVGHFPAREAPDAVAEHLIRHFTAL